MNEFMMPPGGMVPGELPPGLVQGALPPAQPVQPNQKPVQAPPPPEMQMQQAGQAVLQEEGATAPSPTRDGFFDKLRTDPKLSQAMLMMGLRMMQGEQNGQGTMGMLGDAMMAGAAAHNMLKYNEREMDRRDQELAMKSRESNARVTQLEQETSQKAELFPEAKKKLAEEVRQLRASGRKAEADALVAEFKADPARVAEAWRLDQGVKKANITQSNAAAGASGASARAANALAGSREQELKWQQTLADPKATPEAKVAAKQGLDAATPGGGASGKMHDLEARAQLIFQGGLAPTLEEARAKAYQDSLEKKGGDGENLRWLAEYSEDPSVRKAAQEMLAASTLGGKSGQGAPKLGAGKLPLPPGISEDDVAQTAAKRGMTRDAVIEAYNAKQKGK